MSMITATLAPPQQLLSQLDGDLAHRLEAILQRVQETIAPVWPLQDYVAVNPFGGMADRPFHVVREELQAVSDCELLMPLAYYRQQWELGKFDQHDIARAHQELVADGILAPGALPLEGLEQRLESSSVEHRTPRHWQLPSEIVDAREGTDWKRAIVDELGKYCGAHYDEGQARWRSPHQDRSLYQAWRSLAQRDRRMEILGLPGFRQRVEELPSTPEAAIYYLLEKLQVPSGLWYQYLIGVALGSPGWSAWTKHQTEESAKHGFESPDFAGLLAMRLAYEASISLQLGVDVPEALSALDQEQESDAWTGDTLMRLLLLRAQEIGFRDHLLQAVDRGRRELRHSARSKTPPRKTAQMVFCIDVRSERIRRNLESVSSELETFGFAGFFGLPFEYVRMGDHDGRIQHPVLIDPSFQVHETIRGESVQPIRARATRDREHRRGMRYLWKAFQGSAVSGFAFVETAGLLYAAKLWNRMWGKSGRAYILDGVSAQHEDLLGPSLQSLNRQGITTSQQVDMAESILRGVGLLKNFAPLVVFCGHHACTENNPLQAGLDCGACAGHSGEANARFAAQLMNQQYVRQGLLQRGIEIPEDTHFIAGAHNTTSDEIRFFDQDLLPVGHRGYLAELRQHGVLAAQLTREERLPSLRGEDADSLTRRATDWSEVRPEWGLTGNAAFVIGRRELSRNANLEGASFLHSYDADLDPEGKVLEQIMTAPLVVTNWINMQYYASTVDQKNFGSGSKTIHNVVGKFGVLSGGGGDLTTGLPWESIHNGDQHQHAPLRLLTLIEAPRTVVSRILGDHRGICDLVVNGWIHLVVADGEHFYRHTPSGEWEALTPDLSRPPAEAVCATNVA